MSSIKLDQWYEHTVEATLSWREKTAIGMLVLMEKLRTEQETEGPWDKFRYELSDSIPDVHINMQCEFFKGVSDVIVEMKIIFFQKDKITNVNIKSEKIAGTIFQSLFEYFGFVGWNSPRINSVSSFDEKELKSLSAFKS